MDREIKIEARKQYFHYFRVWFVILGIMFVLFLAIGIKYWTKPDVQRGNMSAPSERVYDYADVLTDQEEASLRQLIARTEEEIHCDLVLVTINQEVGISDYEWNMNMRDLADDFYDENQYGYNTIHGDGVLLLDNWYEGQKGSWLSTCGEVFSQFSDYDIDEVLWNVYDNIEYSAYEGYKAYITIMGEKMSGEIPFPLLLMVVPAIIMLIFVCTKLRSPLAEDTTAPSAYVTGGRPVMRTQSDLLARKFISKRIIPRSNGSSSRSGGGGGHVSRGGVSHGGGGRRR